MFQRRFSNNKNIRVLCNRDKVSGYVLGVCISQQDSLKEQFKYTRELQKSLKDFQQKSCTKFVDTKEGEGTEEDICIICLNPLLGPCSQFSCDCKLTLHEGCMFRLILGGFNKCPQCALQLSLENYKPKIRYPKTLKTDSIHKGLMVLLNNESTKENININKLISDTTSDHIKDQNILSNLYI